MAHQFEETYDVLFQSNGAIQLSDELVPLTAQERDVYSVHISDSFYYDSDDSDDSVSKTKSVFSDHEAYACSVCSKPNDKNVKIKFDSACSRCMSGVEGGLNQ